MHRGTQEYIALIKRGFAAGYSGSAHIQEVLPTRPSDAFPIREHLAALHRFADANPIYHNSFRQEVAGVECVAYEGDISEYWLGSIKHGSSCQPFYPTWMASAYVLASTARELGCAELVDIGSGDGRIAFCAALLGMRAYSLEIDHALVELQRRLCEHMKVDFGPARVDALEADYAGMGLSRPALVVGGLPQMGGDLLAASLLDKIVHGSGHTGMSSCIIVLAGAGSRGGLAAGRACNGDVGDSGTLGGWGPTISRYGLRVLHTISLPTVWTFDRDEETPYIYAELAGATSKV